MHREIQHLRQQVENLENHNIRNNLHIYGLAEGLEGSNPLSFFQSFLPTLLGLPDTPPLNI